MEYFRKFFMEDHLEFNRHIPYNLAESGMMSRSLKDILDVLPSEAITELMNISFADSPNWGDEILRDTVASMHEGASRENVLITTGTSEAIFLLFRQLNPRKIALIFPAYQCLYEMPMQYKAELINLPINWDIQGRPSYDANRWFDILKTKKPDLILINNPHNPSGLLITKEILEELLSIARSINATIMGDEHYRFLADENSLLGPTLYRPYQKSFVTGSYMKCLGMSGIRIGWCVGDHEILAKMQNEKVYITHVVSPMTEWVSKKVLIEAKQTLFNQARKEWITNKRAYANFLNRNSKIVSSVPYGGLVTCFGIKGITDTSEGTKQLVEYLIKKDCMLLPLHTMEMGHYQEYGSIPSTLLHGTRLGLGLKPNFFTKALSILEEYLN